MKRKLLLVSAGLTALVLTLLAVYLMPFSQTTEFVESDFRHDLGYVKELDTPPVMSQETGFTCAIVSMAIIANSLGVETTEQGLLSDLGLLDRTTGLLPNEYLTAVNQVLEPLSYSVSMVNPTSQAEILNVISDSLENNLPLVMFYAAPDDWNPPHYNTHFAVVYGIDMKDGIVKISNPYGYLQELSFAELYDGLDFTSYAAEPFAFRLARKVGMVHNNTLFIFEQVK